MAGQRGTKEIGEALNGALDLACLLIELIKDGIQPDDFVKLFAALKNDPRYVAAFSGIKEVPAEIGDLDISEILNLGMSVVSFVPKLLAVFKKK